MKYSKLLNRSLGLLSLAPLKSKNLILACMVNQAWLRISGGLIHKKKLVNLSPMVKKGILKLIPTCYQANNFKIISLNQFIMLQFGGQQMPNRANPRMGNTCPLHEELQGSKITLFKLTLK